MAKMRIISQDIRSVAVWLWSMGLALVPFDQVFLFTLFGDLQVRVAYVIFFLAGILAAWAEKKEFGTRVSLYRLHDIAVTGPWCFLLLFFLWVNLFAAATAEPARSIVYAMGGWFSLVVVAFSAQFLFCERNVRGLALIPSHLRIAFRCYVVSATLLGLSFIFFRLIPGWHFPPLFQINSDVALYFTAGLPFLIWDYINPKRHLLSRPLNALGVVVIVSSLLLMEIRVLFAAAVAAPVALAVVAIVKRIPLQRAFFALFMLSLLSLNVIYIYSTLPMTNQTKQALHSELQKQAQLLESRISREVAQGKRSWEAAKRSNFLGVGVGNSEVKRGIWFQIFAETGLVGLGLYLAFIASLLRRLILIRRSNEIVVSNVAFISLMIFIVFGSHYPPNPYSLTIWVWYALWGVFGSTRKKKAETLDISEVSAAELRLVKN